MTGPLCLSEHLLPVTESIAGGKDRLKKFRVLESHNRGCELVEYQVQSYDPL